MALSMIWLPEIVVAHALNHNRDHVFFFIQLTHHINRIVYIYIYINLYMWIQCINLLCHLLNKSFFLSIKVKLKNSKFTREFKSICVCTYVIRRKRKKKEKKKRLLSQQWTLRSSSAFSSFIFFIIFYFFFFASFTLVYFFFLSIRFCSYA